MWILVVLLDLSPAIHAHLIRAVAAEVVSISIPALIVVPVAISAEIINTVRQANVYSQGPPPALITTNAHGIVGIFKHVVVSIKLVRCFPVINLPPVIRTTLDLEEHNV